MGVQTGGKGTTRTMKRLSGIALLVIGTLGTALRAQEMASVLWMEEVKLVPVPQQPVWTIQGVRTYLSDRECKDAAIDLLYGSDLDILRFLESKRPIPSLQNALQPGEVVAHGNSTLTRFIDAEGRPLRQIRLLCLPAAVDPRP